MQLPPEPGDGLLEPLALLSPGRLPGPCCGDLALTLLQAGQPVLDIRLTALLFPTQGQGQGLDLTI
jgi:hypothetical protein